jgi:AraC-like DNA-binding protein
MAENLDLFGMPILDRQAPRGRPKYEPSDRDTNVIKMLLALGWSNERIANAIAVSVSTLQRHFRRELKGRFHWRDRLNARRFEIAFEQANAGNMQALKELGRMIEVNDRMEIEREMSAAPKKDDAPTERIGKKQIDERRAMDADADLMAELENEAQMHVIQ